MRGPAPIGRNGRTCGMWSTRVLMAGMSRLSTLVARLVLAIGLAEVVQDMGEEESVVCLTKHARSGWGTC